MNNPEEKRGARRRPFFIRKGPTSELVEVVRVVLRAYFAEQEAVWGEDYLTEQSEVIAARTATILGYVEVVDHAGIMEERIAKHGPAL